MTADTAFWNNRAEKYSKQPVKNPEAFNRKIAITKSRITAQDTVLDVGCGTGSLALRLAESGAQIHGVDISSEMIRIARGKAAAQHVANVTFHVNVFDDSFTVFAPATLDGICAYAVLPLVDNPRQVLAYIFRLLKPGGFFVSSSACLGGTLIPYGAIIAVMRAFGKAPHVKLFTHDALLREIAGAGFVDIQQPDVGAKSNIAFVVATKPR